MLKIFELEKTNYIRVIWFLEEKQTISSLARTINKDRTSLYPPLKRLLELGVIEDRFQREGGIKRFFKLTEKGKMVLEYLKKINEILQDE
ncbi:MAG: helix-turn-helix transcriptional regulator [Candidatus Helarchaeota archaeon]